MAARKISNLGSQGRTLKEEQERDKRRRDLNEKVITVKVQPNLADKRKQGID